MTEENGASQRRVSVCQISPGRVQVPSPAPETATGRYPATGRLSNRWQVERPLQATRDEAEAAQRRVADQPGFRDLPDGFSVDEAELGQIGWLEGFVTPRPGEE
jgi:hypothetical protein